MRLVRDSRLSKATSARSISLVGAPDLSQQPDLHAIVGVGESGILADIECCTIEVGNGGIGSALIFD
jgi:hypothetical protein